MQKLVFTNGGGQTIDLTSGNFGITNWEGLSNTGLNIQTQQVPFQDGGVFLDALMEQREISVTVAIQDNNDLSARYELKRQLISALNPKLGEGVLVYTNDYLSRQIKAVPQLPIFENKNSNDAGTLKASVVFSCPSPYWEDLEDTVVSIKGLQSIENKGDVSASVNIIIPTGSVNPTVVNQTNGKKISIQGEFEKNILIDTHFGQKSAIEKDIVTNAVLGQVFHDLIYNDDKIIFVGEGILTQNYYTGEKQEVYQGEILYCITYNNGIYIAVGKYGAILTSSNGINWAQQNSGVSQNLNYITHSNDMFVIVGDNGTILTSTDGISWTLQDGAGNHNLKGIAFGNGVFIAQGVDYIIKSQDGVNWSEIETTYIASVNNKIRFVNNYFYSLGQQVIKSADGEVWTQVISEAITNNFQDMMYYNGVFVIVGTNGLIGTSTNETDWIFQTVGESNILSVQLLNNMLYAVTNNGGIIISNDGSNWFYETKDWEFGSCTNICYAEDLGLYVAVGSQSKVIISNNGVDWTMVESESSGSLTKIIYIKQLKLLIAVGANGRVKTSKDGISWNTQRLGNNILSNVQYLNNEIVIYNSSSCYKSQNGEMWIELECSGLSRAPESVIYQKGKYIAVGGSISGNGFIATSNDGLNWTQETQYNVIYYKIIYENGVYVIIGRIQTSETGAVITTSIDGISWTTQYFNDVSGAYDICYADNIFVIPLNQKILFSSDGINWEEKNASLNTRYITFGQEKFLTIMNAISFITLENATNIISLLTTDSDMTFDLVVGFNVVLSDMEKNIKITYRQKYLGV